MEEIVNRVLGNNLADFEGLEISGSIPLRDAFLNKAIAGFLQSLRESETAATPQETGAPVGDQTVRPALDTKSLLQMVKKVEVHSEPGVVTVRFEVKR